MINKNVKWHVAAITCQLLFGVNSSVMKSLLSSSWMTVIGFTFTRFVFCFVMYWSIGFFMPKEKITVKDVLLMLRAGSLGIIITMVAFPAALQFISPIIISLVAALTPIVVMLFSALFLRESLSFKKTIGIVLGISGAALVILHNGGSGHSPNSLPGFFLALIYLLANGGYYVVLRITPARFGTITMMKWIYLFATVLFVVPGIMELPKQRVFSAEATLPVLLQFGFVLILVNVLGIFLLTVSIRHIKATTVSMYINLQPLAASITAILIGQDILTWDKPLALLLIASGVFLVSRSNSILPSKITNYTNGSQNDKQQC